jgi:hypothetical protein
MTTRLWTEPLPRRRGGFSSGEQLVWTREDPLWSDFSLRRTFHWWGKTSPHCSGVSFDLVDPSV